VVLSQKASGSKYHPAARGPAAAPRLGGRPGAAIGPAGATMEEMAHDPFDVGLGELRDWRGPKHVVRRGPLLEALVADVDSRIPAGQDAEADVLLEPFDGGLAVSGTARSRWEGECRRCLRSVGGEVVADVKEIFRRGGGPDEGTYPMGDDHVNLREVVLDSLFAGLPLLPLCRQECQGICPVCGTDRNVSSCECAVVVPDPRWSALDVLKVSEAADRPTGPGR